LKINFYNDLSFPSLPQHLHTVPSSSRLVKKDLVSSPDFQKYISQLHVAYVSFDAFSTDL